jgi:glycosyltransferase involved in cell wall biosynthesis
MKEIIENTGISVILPVHELKEETKQMLTNAVQSVTDQIVRPDELIIVAPKGSDVIKFCKGLENKTEMPIIIAENEGETDFATQVNYGVSQAKSEWVSILEYDDEYAKIWFKNVLEYKDAHKNVELFLPIVIDVDSTGNFIGFTNEAVWANSFSDELGVLDNNALLAYQNFNIDGMVIKKSVYEEFGGFKPSIKLTFIYEFLLRMTFKDVKTMVIPKFGYKHVNQRNGSLFSSYKETMDPVEAKWWLSTAKKEYYFPNDRKITYELKNE